MLTEQTPARSSLWHVLLSLRAFHAFAQAVWRPCLLFALLLIMVSLWMGLTWSPSDYQQGDAYRIMYVHVPCAAMSLGVYAGMAVLAAVFLIWHIKLADVMLEALAPLGWVYTVCALVTGAIWGQPIWGTWWIWDARLTSELILAFVYAGIILLRSAYGAASPGLAAKPCALLTLVGVVNLPMIHYSVVWWHTLHQKASVLAWQRPTMDAHMLWPLLGAMAGFVLLTLAWLCWRSSQIIVQREARTTWVRAQYDAPRQKHSGA